MTELYELAALIRDLADALMAQSPGPQASLAAIRDRAAVLAELPPCKWCDSKGFKRMRCANCGRIAKEVECSN